MSEDLKYKNVKRMTRDEILEAFNSQAPERIQDALWSAAYFDQDWRWVQDQCLRYLTFPDLWVRINRQTSVFWSPIDLMPASSSDCGSDAGATGHKHSRDPRRGVPPTIVRIVVGQHEGGR
jgi:hypothetical protein